MKQLFAQYKYYRTDRAGLAYVQPWINPVHAAGMCKHVVMNFIR